MVLLHLGLRQFILIMLASIDIFHWCLSIPHIALSVTNTSARHLFCGILTQSHWFGSSSLLRLKVALSALAQMSSHVIIVGGAHSRNINRMVHTNRRKFSSSLLCAYPFVGILKVLTALHFGTVRNGLILLLPLYVLSQLCSRQKLRVVQITCWISVKHQIRILSGGLVVSISLIF